MYGLRLITPPASEPITVDQAKLHLRVVWSDEDALITSLITAARQLVEEETYRQLITASWRFTIDRFPIGRGDLLLPRAPLQSITSITYVAPDGTTQTLSSSLYQVSSGREPARLIPPYGQIWPIVRWQTSDAVTINFQAGYGNDATAVPELLKHAIRMLIGHWYENREEVGMVGQPAQVPLGAQRIMDQYAIGDLLSRYGGRGDTLPNNSIDTTQAWW